MQQFNHLLLHKLLKIVYYSVIFLTLYEVDMKKKLQRVDIQVSILTAIIVLFSSFFIFTIGYNTTYNDMINSMQQQVLSLYDYVTSRLDEETFTNLNSKEDCKTELYVENQEMLRNAHDASGVLYLYTAKENSDGDLIYLLDGLDPTSDDFRVPGDLIEQEIQDNLHLALSGQNVLPNKILNTEWGYIFISYMPVYDEDQIIGVIGIEFEAEHHFITYQNLKIYIPIIILFACGLASLIASYVFKKISNPFYKDMSNTDQLTSLKNRNAFEVDIDNFSLRYNPKEVSVISIDLNNLKKINDQLGHLEGDKYIQEAAQVIDTISGSNRILYRIGGDEFVIIILNPTQNEEISIIDSIQQLFLLNKNQRELPLSAAMGYAVYENYDINLRETFRRADLNMYQNKIESKK